MAVLRRTIDRARRCRKGFATVRAPEHDGWLHSVAYFCIKVFSETDLTEDLKKIQRANAGLARR